MVDADPFALRTTVTELNSWITHLDGPGIGHSPIIKASSGYGLGFLTPDGMQIRLYAEDDAVRAENVDSDLCSEGLRSVPGSLLEYVARPVEQEALPRVTSSAPAGGTVPVRWFPVLTDDLPGRPDNRLVGDGALHHDGGAAGRVRCSAPTINGPSVVTRPSAHPHGLLF